MNNRRISFVALIFLATIVACAVPGLRAPSAPVFAPTVEPSRLENMVAETVSAAIAQTEQARPTLPPTSIPTSTSTSAPTASVTSTSEMTSSGSTLTVQVDASTVFADEQAGYEITVPAAWLVMRIKEQEYLDAWQLAEAADANVQQALLSVQNEDPNILRLFAIDAQADHIQNGFVTNIKFVLDEKNSISFKNDAELKASAAQFAKTVPGLEVLSTKISTANKITVGLIEMKSTIKNSSGTDVVVFQKQAVFNTAAGQTTITLSTVDGLKGTLFPVFDAMLATIKISTK